MKSYEERNVMQDRCPCCGAEYDGTVKESRARQKSWRLYRAAPAMLHALGVWLDIVDETDGGFPGVAEEAVKEATGKTRTIKRNWPQ